VHPPLRMGKIYALSTLLLFARCLPSAEMWTGQLFDANCVEQNKELQKYEECKPATRTASFSLQASGRMLKLDANGDKKAAAAWRDYLDSADRSTNPDARHQALTAVIQGTVNGDLIKVDAILLR
jgi:hypothetical protein